MSDLGDGTESVWLNPDGKYVGMLQAEYGAQHYIHYEGFYIPFEEWVEYE